MIRRIRPDDKELLARGLQELSPTSVYRRFLTPKRRFTASELRCRQFEPSDKKDRTETVSRMKTVRIVCCVVLW